jgi:sarcosine oxidase
VHHGGVDAGADLVVVGLGAMGGATLWRAAARGLRAVGVDRFDPPHDRGSTHGGSRLIRTAYFEDPAYLPLLREAFALWRALEAEAGETLLTMTGAAMIGRADSEVITGALRTARMHDLPHEMLDCREAARRFPQFALRDDEVLFHEDGGGVLRPERSVAAALRLARARGARVITRQQVTRIEPRGGGVRVHLHGGDAVDARRAVACAGAWTPALLPSLRAPLSVERQVNAWFDPRDAALYAPQRFPVFIRELPGGHFVYGLPAIDGDGVKLAVHHEGQRVDPDNVPRTITDADLQPLRDHATRCLHGLDLQPRRAITCVYTNTPDEHFVIGVLPEAPQVVVVSACSGHGFKFAPVVADIAVDLAVDGGTERAIAPFALTRFH